jgi:hypothetical protein
MPHRIAGRYAGVTRCFTGEYTVYPPWGPVPMGDTPWYHRERTVTSN